MLETDCNVQIYLRRSISLRFTEGKHAQISVTLLYIQATDRGRMGVVSTVPRYLSITSTICCKVNLPKPAV